MTLDWYDYFVFFGFSLWLAIIGYMLAKQAIRLQRLERLDVTQWLHFFGLGILLFMGHHHDLIDRHPWGCWTLVVLWIGNTLWFIRLGKKSNASRHHDTLFSPQSK